MHASNAPIIRRPSIWALIATLAFVTPALAQPNSAPASPPTPPLGRPVPPEIIKPIPTTPRTMTAAPPPQNGVITPTQPVDPGIQAPAPVPNPRTTPVIPPPGTPGGQDAPRPK